MTGAMFPVKIYVEILRNYLNNKLIIGILDRLPDGSLYINDSNLKGLVRATDEIAQYSLKNPVGKKILEQIFDPKVGTQRFSDIETGLVNLIKAAEKSYEKQIS